MTKCKPLSGNWWWLGRNGVAGGVIVGVRRADNRRHAVEAEVAATQKTDCMMRLELERQR